MEWFIVCLPAIIILGAVIALSKHEMREDEELWQGERKRMPPPYYEDEK